MSPYDLTTLAALKAWLGLPSTGGPNDATLSALITATSRSIYAALSRPALTPLAYSETFDLETARVYLRHWPVLQVTSVAWRGIAVPSDTNPDLDASFGYVLEQGDPAPPGRPQALDLIGRQYRPGRQSLAVSYTAGYAVNSEAQTIPLSAPYQLSALAPYGAWASDLGVVYASSGAALAPVAASPAVGQYAVMSGVYSFASADAGRAVLISYGYTPQDVAQAALELAAYRFRSAERIGLNSKSIGGQETISYDTSAIPAPILSMLQPYRRVAV